MTRTAWNDYAAELADIRNDSDRPTAADEYESPSDHAARVEAHRLRVAARAHLVADHAADWGCCDLPSECHANGSAS